MWPSHIAKPLKRAPIKRSAEDGEDLARRCMGDLRGRHGMFRMPDWMSEDDDMSDLAHRMSHAPHFATMGRRGGPWRERRSSGGSAMSATSEDDSCDAANTDKSSQCSGGSAEGPSSHEIPIRLEAPAPPSVAQQQQTENEPVAPLRANHIRKTQQYPMRTTSAVDASDHSRDVPRNTRCASAPPEMADQSQQMQDNQTPPQQQRFVSKINITPQAPQSPGSPQTKAAPFSPLPAKFNTVPKPFIPANKPQTSQQQSNEDQQQTQQSGQTPSTQQQVPPQTPQQYHQQQPQYQQQYHQQQSQYNQQQPQYNQQHPQYHQQYHQPQPQPQPQQQSPRQSGQRPSVVRNIPIFVEGRDGPIVNEESGSPPKPAPQWGQQWQQQQAQQHQNQVPQQQQQRQQFKQQHHPQQPQTQPIPQPVPMPMPMPQPQSQSQPQQQPQHQQQPPEAKPQQPAKDPRLTQIEAVKVLVDEYRTKVEAFSGSKKDREFLYLDEMLTRALLQLDNVDPDGRDDVRQARRAVIKDINAAISLLESKATEIEAKKEKTPVPETMETDPQEATAESNLAENEAKVQNVEKTEGKEESAEKAEGQSTEGDKEKVAEEVKEAMETTQDQSESATSTNNQTETTGKTST